MSSLWIAAVALMGSPEKVQPIEAPPECAVTPLPPAELRATVRLAIRASHDDDQGFTEKVPCLAQAYELVAADTQLSSSERERHRQMLRSRLIVMGDAIVDAVKRERAQMRRELAKARRERREAAKLSGDKEPKPGSPASYPLPSYPLPAADDEDGAAGGPAEKEGAALVELIRTTIAPQTWDVAGGEGTIVYYQPLKVLVIRQTSDVHWMIGGLRGALGK